jgi:hypothetical protein
MMTTAAATTATTVTLVIVIAVAPPHALVVLSVSHDCLSLTPVSLAAVVIPPIHPPNFKPSPYAETFVPVPSQALRHDGPMTIRSISCARKPISSASDTTAPHAAKRIAAAL